MERVWNVNKINLVFFMSIYEKVNYIFAIEWCRLYGDGGSKKNRICSYFVRMIFDMLYIMSEIFLALGQS